ncbi:MAG: VgrG-related protein, partial [Actinomycetota bacterium]
MTSTATFRVTAGGAPLPNAVAGMMVEAYVDDSSLLPDLFVLTFSDPDRTVLKDSGLAIGTKVSIEVISDEDPGGTPLVTDAEVTALEAEFDTGGAFTVVRGLDQTHRLMRGRRTEAYMNMTFADIARQVAQRAGLTAGNIQATTPVFDQVSQGNTSDWHFLRGMARELGYQIRVVDGKLDFGPPPGASGGPAGGNFQSTAERQLVLGENLRQFRSVVTSAEQVGSVTVRSWDPKTKREMVATAQAATTTAVLGDATTPASLASKFGNPTFLSAEVPYDTQGECDGAAKAIAQEIASAFASFDGVADGDPTLTAGAAVSLGLVGDPFDGRYTLATTRHLYTRHEGYTTWFTVSGSHDRSLPGLAARQPGARSWSASGPPIYGVVPAIVTDARDPDKLGRVKLKLPWLSDTYETFWARTVHTWAGKNYGSLVAPEVGDEVLAAFEQGDLRRPYVIGGLYNGQDNPYAGDLPLIDEASGKVNKRQLTSRTGHLLVFADKEGTNDGITMQTSDGKYVLKLAKNTQTVTLSSDGSITIEATGAPGTITIKATGNLDLQGNQVSIKGQTGVTISAPAGKVAADGLQVALNAQAEGEFKSSGAL